MNTRLGLLGLIALEAARMGGAEIKPIERRYPEQPAPAGREVSLSRITPHIGKKQIAKALRRAAKKEAGL